MGVYVCVYVCVFDRETRYVSVCVCVEERLESDSQTRVADSTVCVCAHLQGVRM